MKKRKKLYLVVIIATVALIGIKYMESLRNVEIVDGKASISRNTEWNGIISSCINDGIIKLNVDGSTVRINSEDIYMDENLNAMISTKLLTPLFSCATNRYYHNMIVIEKGGTKVTVNAYSDEIIVDGETKKADAISVIKNNNIYIPVTILKDYFSYDYVWDYKDNTISLTNTKPDEKIFPYKYDYRDNKKNVDVGNQGDLGTCWSFAALTALETSMMPERRLSFSVDHMTMHNGYNLTQAEGGEYTMAMAYLASWKGPVREEDDPYGDGISPEDADVACHVQEMQIIESKNLDGIKKAVFLYGGVQSSLYMSVWDADGHDSQYYNLHECAYCYIGTEKANHDIVIVGWDDSYPASKFATEPEGDGAFICVNSWGEQFGDSGYFYVSYYDSNIALHNLVYTGIEYTNNYDNIYQSDICGWVGQLGYGRDNAYFANVYEAKSNEELEAVSFYATGTDTEYKVYFVNKFTDTSSFNDKELVAEGVFSNAGYYTVKLDNERYLAAGEKYAIVVYIRTPNSVHPIAIEYHSDSSTATVDISDGEGYISLFGTQWEHVEATQKCNICLKMFTNDVKLSED